MDRGCFESVVERPDDITYYFFRYGSGAGKPPNANKDGLARALRPVHTPLDGDVVFALSTGRRDLADPVADLAQLGTAAADCLARAVARGVFEAQTLGEMRGYRDVHG